MNITWAFYYCWKPFVGERLSPNARIHQSAEQLPTFHSQQEMWCVPRSRTQLYRALRSAPGRCLCSGSGPLHEPAMMCSHTLLPEGPQSGVLAPRDPLSLLQHQGNAGAQLGSWTPAAHRETRAWSCLWPQPDQAQTGPHTTPAWMSTLNWGQFLDYYLNKKTAGCRPFNMICV